MLRNLCALQMAAPSSAGVVLQVHRIGAGGLGFRAYCTFTILSPVSMRCLSVAITGSPAPTVACMQDAGRWRQKMLEAGTRPPTKQRWRHHY
jgi:hypothetical protein